MINIDEDALICDLAETYHIFDYRSLPCKTVATFSCGLKNDSRSKMKLAGARITTEEMLLAAIVDNTNLLAWLQSKDATTGRNRPKSLLIELMLPGIHTSSDGNVAFDTAEEFDEAWRELTRKEDE